MQPARIRFPYAALALLFAHASVAPAEDTPLIPRADFFASATNDLRISPDGSHYLHLVTLGNIITSLSLEFTDGSEASRSIKPNAEGLTVACWWSYDPDLIIIQKRKSSGLHLYTYDLSTNETLPLHTSRQTSAHLVHLSAAYPDEALVAVADQGATTIRVWRTNLRTGEQQRAIDFEDTFEVFFDNDFRPRVAVRHTGICGLELFRIDDSGNRSPLRTLGCDHTNVDRRPNGGIREVVGVDASGKTLYLVDNTGREKSALLAINLDTNNETLLAESTNADLLPGTLVDPVSRRPLAARSHFEKFQYQYVDSDTQKDIEYLNAHFSAPVEIIEQSKDGTAWVVTPLTGAPRVFHIFSRTSSQVREAFPAFPKMDGHKLGTRRGHVITLRDGLRVPIHVYLPPGADPDGDGIPNRPLPALLYAHGGPDSITDWDHWNGRTVRSQQLLANRGYAAIRIEYRGAGGFGNQLRELGHREWGTEVVQDLVDIKQWAVNAGIAQPDRTGIWGFSHGGYLALAALTFAPGEFACAFAWSPLVDLQAKVEQWKDTEYAADLRDQIGDERTEEGLALFAAQSIIGHAENVSKPVLIAAGGRDRLSDDQHARPLVDRMVALEKEITYLHYPNETHSFSQTRSWTSLWAVAEQFFAQHLGGRYQPAGRDYPSRELQVREGTEFIRLLGENRGP